MFGWIADLIFLPPTFDCHLIIFRRSMLLWCTYLKNAGQIRLLDISVHTERRDPGGCAISILVGCKCAYRGGEGETLV